MPQGLAIYAGVRALLDCSFTLSQGISPSVCTMTIAPQPASSLASNGVLTFVYGSNRVQFPGCRIDKIDSLTDGEGKTVWQLTILDRRVLWRSTGQVSGFYNVRRGEATILAGTLKRPRELAKLCLDAMGERGYDVSQLPNDVYPEIAWEYANPAEALASLCDSLGCRVCLDVDNRVKIVRVGVGRNVSANAFFLDGEFSLDPPDPPDKIVIVSARNRYQADLKLEAVGMDLDRKVKPINKLTYAPRVRGVPDWRYSDLDHFLNLPDRKARGLAQQSVYRWFRPVVPLRLPGVQERIEQLDRILPLESSQIETWQTAEGRTEARPPWVYGRYWDGYESMEPSEEGLVRDVANKPRGLYSKGFTVEQETGIVKFSEPVYLLIPDVTAPFGGRISPPDIYLRIACGLRDKETRAWDRTEYERRPAGRRRANFIQYVVKEEISRERYISYSQPTGMRDNLRETQAEAAHYLSAEEARYRSVDSGSATYAGLHPINLDGAIQQVTWIVTQEGYAYTRLSRNREELLVTPSYEERRLYERLNRALAERDKAERHRADDLRRKRG